MIQGDGYVIVEYGDYLGTIANRVGVSVPQLQKINGISNPDLIHVGQKIKIKEEPKEKPLEKKVVEEKPKETTKEKVDKNRKEIKDEDVKTSKETQCCPMIAPWKVLEFDEEGTQRTYVLEIAEELTNNGEKTAKEVVSKGQKVSEHNLYMVAPPADKDGNPQTKEIEVDFTFIKNPCNYTIFVKNKTLSKKKEIETGEERVAKQAKFTVDTEGHIEGTYDYMDSSKKDKKYKTYRTQPNATLGGVDAASKIKEINEEISIYQNLNDPYAQFRISQLEKERIKYEAMIITYSEEDSEEEYQLVGRLIYELTGYDWRHKKIQILPIGGKECDLQPKIYLHVRPYFELSGSIEFSASVTHTLSHSETQYKTNKKTGAVELSTTLKAKEKFGEVEVIKQKVKPNEGIKINRGFFEISDKINITLGSLNRKHESEVKIYKKTSAHLESRNPQKNLPKHNPKATKIVKHKDAGEMFSGFQEKINRFYRTLDAGKKGVGKSEHGRDRKYSLGTTGLKIFIPKGTSFKYVEDDSSHLCGYVGEFSIQVRIFDGVNVTLDFVDILIARTGPFSTQLREWRDELEGDGMGFSFENIKNKITGKKPNENAKDDFNVKGELKAYISLNGGVKGTCSWKRTKVSEKFKPQGTLEGYVSFTMEAKAEMSVTVLTIKGEAGAGLIIASQKSKLKTVGISAKAYADQDDSGEISFSGRVDFTGLTVYYMCFTRLKLVNDSKMNVEGDTNSSRTKRNLPIDTKQSTELVKSELKEKQEVLPECNLFDAMGIQPIESKSTIEKCFL